MACLSMYVAKPILICCRSLQEATQLAHVNSKFHKASKEIDVLQWWASMQLLRVDNCLTDRFWLMDCYLDWVKERKNEEVTQRTLSGLYADLEKEKRELLNLLIIRCTATQSLSYISSMFKDGVFHLVALLARWCAVLEESMSDVLQDWVRALDEQLQDTKVIEKFESIRVERKFRQPLLARWKKDMDILLEPFARRKESEVMKAWESSRTRWVCLFLEEHLTSFGESKWGVPTLVESMVAGHVRETDGLGDFGYYSERFYERACEWGCCVSFKEWHDAVHASWNCTFDDIFEEPDQDSDSDFDASSSSSFCSWKTCQRRISDLHWGTPCTNIIRLLRHFALITKHWQCLERSVFDSHNRAECQDEMRMGIVQARTSIPKLSPVDVDITDDVYLQIAPTISEYLAKSHRCYFDPWFWIEGQNAVLAFAPEAPPLVRKVLRIKNTPGNAPHALRRVMTRFRHAAFEGNAINLEACNAGLAMTRGLLDIMAMQIVRMKRGAHARCQV